MVGRASGLPLTYKQITKEQYAETLAEQGLHEDAAGSLAAMYEVLARGEIADPTGEVATVLGRPAGTFEDYAIRAAAAGAWQR